MALDDKPPLQPQQPAGQPAATPETPAQSAPAGDGPKKVRLGLADWRVDAVEFPTGEKNDDGDPVRVTVSRSTPYLVDEADADKYVAAAALHGFALTKEPVA